jgi:hypothetical protein
MERFHLRRQKVSFNLVNLILCFPKVLWIFILENKPKLSHKGTNIEKKDNAIFWDIIVRDLLKQVFKTNIKFFNGFILLFLHLIEFQQKHVRITSSTPSLHEKLIEVISSIDTLTRKNIIPSPSIFNKSGRKEFHHYISSIIINGTILETSPKFIQVFLAVVTSLPENLRNHFSNF